MHRDNMANFLGVDIKPNINQFSLLAIGALHQKDGSYSLTLMTLFQQQIRYDRLPVKKKFIFNFFLHKIASFKLNSKLPVIASCQQV